MEEMKEIEKRIGKTESRIEKTLHSKLSISDTKLLVMISKWHKI